MSIKIRGWLLAHVLLGVLLAGGRVYSDPEPLLPTVEAFPGSGQAPLTVLFSGLETTGKWGSVNDIDTWEWDFTFDYESLDPDPSYLHNALVAYTYDRSGTYTCRLRVTDTPNVGGPREAFVEITVHVEASSVDSGERSEYPPGAWGAGINFVWAGPEEQEAAQGYYRPVGQIFLQWDQVEPEEHGLYDWTRLDGKLEQEVGLGRRVSVQINSRLPDWLFDHIAQTGTARDMRSPQFWDPDYIRYYKELISALAGHIAASPYADHILYVRQQWNAVHTETTFYDSTTSEDAMGTWVDNPNWVWPSDGHHYEVEWTEEIAVDYERQIITHFLDEFTPLGIGVTLRAIQSHLPENEQNAYYTDDHSTEWILITNNNYMKWDGGKQHTREFAVMRCFGALGFAETWSDSEHRIAEKNPELSPQQDIYGVVLRVLEVGLPYIGIYGRDLAIAADDGEFEEAFNFANRYAGWHLFPKSAPGAWLVLGRFEGSTDWRRLQTLVRDNWGYFIRQNDPAGTSTPVSLVGDSSCRFGLTARRIDSTATFDLDDAFAGAIRGEVVELRVTVLEDSGSLQVRVDEDGTLVEVDEYDHEDHKGWRTLIYMLEGPRFSDGPDGETDFALVPEEGSPIIHMIEINRDHDLPDNGDDDSYPDDHGSAASSGAGCGCFFVA